MGARTRTAFLVVTVAFTAVAAGPLDPTKARDDLKRLQGTWTLIAYAVDGRILRGEDANSTMTFQGDRWSITWRKNGGGDQVEHGVVRMIDVSGQPRVMDLVHEGGPSRGSTTRAFYQVDGDALRYSSLALPASVGDAQVVTATLTWKRKAR